MRQRNAPITGWPVFLAIMTLAMGVGVVLPVSAQPVLVNPFGQQTSFVEPGNLDASVLFDLAFETNGTAWIAASDGLRRYDGYQWSLFDTRHGLPSRYVRTVLITPQGVLWVGTDHGAGTFDGQRFTLVAPPDRLAGPSVRRIRPTADGTTWFCSDKWPDRAFTGGLTALRHGQWRVYRMRDGLPSDHVYNYFEDSKGRGFALTDKGVAQKTGESWRRVIDEAVWDLVEMTNGWVVGFSGDKCYRLEDDRWMVTSYPSLHANRHPPKGLCLTSRGDLLAYGEGRWNGHQFEPLGPLSMVDVIPEAIREAPDGAVWCLDMSLLTRWEARPGSWLEYTNLPPPQFVLPSGNMVFTSLYEAYLKVGGDFVPAPELRGDPARMAMDPAGGVWSWSSNSIACYREGLRPYGAAQTGLARVDGEAMDGQGRLWFYGAGKGEQPRVACYDGDTWRKQPVSQLNGKTIHMAVGDPVSGVWFSVVNPASQVNFIHVDRDQVTTKDWRPLGVYREAPNLMVDHEATLWAYGEWGVFRAPQRGAGGWHRFESLDATVVLEALAGPHAAWFVFSGEHGGQSGFGCYRQGRWQQVTTYMTLFLERSEAGERAKTRVVYSGHDDTLCFGGYNSIHLVPHGDIREHRKITLPEGRSLDSPVVLDLAGTLWVGALRPDNMPCVLAFRSDGVPPRAVLTSAPGQVSPNGTWQVKVRGLKRFAPENDRRSFLFSWRFDDRAWTAPREFPSEGLPVGDLKPGRHTFQVRAQDEGKELQVEPTQATFTVLSPPLQEQIGFKAAVWCTVALMIMLALVVLERARKLARANDRLSGEVNIRRRAEEELQQAQTELQGTNQRLEKRVEERTAELAETNRSLRDEIAECERMEEEQRQLEAKMLQTQKLESLGVLAGGIAHDFNNMLTTIMGNADLALSAPGSPAPIREHLQDILTTSRRAADLCLQMLAYSGRGRFIIRRINLSDLVRDTAQMLAVSISKNTPLTMRLASNLPWVEADATQLRQIVMNLVINASEAIGERHGGITLTTRVRHGDRAWLDSLNSPDRLEEGDYVILEVQDSGCGMDPTTMRRVFDPFFTTKFTGRGLGLAAVLGIVRGHRGAIQVESEPEKGTTFTILLPPARNGSPTPSSDDGGPPAGAIRRQKGTVLLVEDEADLRTVAAKMLERLGYEILAAKNGLEAIEIVKNATRKIDCVLLDWNMPRLNGIETFRELRLLRPGLCAVLASGYCEEELAQRFGGDGLAGFVQKPYTTEALAKILAHAISRAETGSVKPLPADRQTAALTN